MPRIGTYELVRQERRRRGDSANFGAGLSVDGLMLRAEEAAHTGSFECDLRTGQASYSPGFRRIYGVGPDERLDARFLTERIVPEDRQLVEQTLARAERLAEPFTFEFRISRADGGERILRARGGVLGEEAGPALRLVGGIQDVTEELHARWERELLSSVVDSSDDAILTKDSEGIITSWNPAAERLYGYTAEEAIGKPVSIVAPPELAGEIEEITRDVFSGATIDHRETERMRKDGSRVIVSLSISPVRGRRGNIVAASVIARDITERHRYERRLRYLADHDQLTGLLNRRRFEEDLKRELARVGRYRSRGALLSIDLDNFKPINDYAGHAAGDAVLVEIAQALRQRLRTTDVIGRLGGDEFGVVLLGVRPDEARRTAEDLSHAIETARPAFGGKVMRVGASIGVAPFEADDATAAELLVHADLAMYAAKTSGGHGVVLYAPEEARQARMMMRQSWSDRIRAALKNDDFVLIAQPILDLNTGRFNHAEFLLRMRDSRGKLIAPGAFLPVAEREGLIYDIDRWVVSKAIELIAGFAETTVKVGINLSGETVAAGDDLLEVIERELVARAVDPSRLIFEVTETAAIANMPRASRFAAAVTRLGCNLALDDFGTGFGSFYYLKHLPVHYLKVDSEFIQNLPHSKVDEHMVRGIATVARGLGIKTVAEGVADEDTLRLLHEEGVDYAQGFYVAKPGAVGKEPEPVAVSAANRASSA